VCESSECVCTYPRDAGVRLRSKLYTHPNTHTHIHTHAKCINIYDVYMYTFVWFLGLCANKSMVFFLFSFVVFFFSLWGLRCQRGVRGPRGEEGEPGRQGYQVIYV
jgi:hypothetical protein